MSCTQRSLYAGEQLCLGIGLKAQDEETSFRASIFQEESLLRYSWVVAVKDLPKTQKLSLQAWFGDLSFHSCILSQETEKVKKKKIL